MNDYIGEARKRRQNLLIVEGNHEKNELFMLLFRCFPEMKISIDDIWIYGTNIYMLYDDIVNEYGEEWEEDDIDLPFIISKKQGFIPLRYKEDFTNIILVFDYERHDAKFSEKKIVQMQRCFMDSTDMGKLYINYPMIESYQNLCSLPDESYAEKKIPVTLRPGKKYKAFVRKDSVVNKFIDFPHKINDLLEKHFKIFNSKKRKKCCDEILEIKTKDNLLEQIQCILDGNIEKDLGDTAKYQLKAMINHVEYANRGQTYWQYMRKIFIQIIFHNIYKAVQIQCNDHFKESRKNKEQFNRINLEEILTEQNIVSKDYEKGFIWVLCTCIFLIPEYNFNLISEG